MAAFPVTTFLWQQYARYCESTIKIPDVVLSVYQRAVRNCPWHGALWGRLLTAMERSGATQDRQQAQYNKALQAGLQVCGLVFRCAVGGEWEAVQQQEKRHTVHMRHTKIQMKGIHIHTHTHTYK